MTIMINLPPHNPRMETGTVRFGSDWPGIFIRGDNALYYAMILKQVLAAHRALNPRPKEIDDFVVQGVLRDMVSLLESCRLSKLL